jgi:DNA-binding transcriptional regulator YhcF (GntR family)
MSVKDAKIEILKLIKSYKKKDKHLWRNEIDRKLHLNPLTFKKAISELEEEEKITTEMGVIEEKVVVNRERQALLFKSNNK